MIRKATMQDLPAIMDIYAYARNFMVKTGNANQWGDGYPQEKLLRDDIAQKQLYMIEQSGAVCGVFVFIIGEDPTYAVIDEGAWLSDSPYGTIHRVASNGTVHGIMKQIVGFCRAQIHHLRIDTHADNHIMQHLILQCGFTRRGIIYVRDGSNWKKMLIFCFYLYTLHMQNGRFFAILRGRNWNVRYKYE